MMFISNHLGEPAMYSVCERLYLPVTSASRGAINVRRPGRNGTRRVLGGARDGLGATSVFGENSFGVRWDEMPEFPGKT